MILHRDRSASAGLVKVTNSIGTFPFPWELSFHSPGTVRIRVGLAVRPGHSVRSVTAMSSFPSPLMSLPLILNLKLKRGALLPRKGNGLSGNKHVQVANPSLCYRAVADNGCCRVLSRSDCSVP